MKLDKTSFRSVWIYARTVLNVALCAAVIRLRPGTAQTRSVALFGHQYGGNLKALELYARKLGETSVCFVAIDPHACRSLREQGVDALTPLRLRECLRILRCDVIVTDHGPGPFLFVVGRVPVRFADVWHGVGFKALGESWRKVHARYDLVCAPSAWYMENCLFKQEGVPENRVRVTGYALTDLILRPDSDRAGLLKKLDLPPEAERIILFAPTWKHDGPENPLSPQTILESVSQWARKNHAIVVFRSHLNAGLRDQPLPEGVFFRPMATYPDTLSLLQISDILISDWSSIASDFLPLGRPTLFMDCPPPFKGDYLLTPEDRCGIIIRTTDDIPAALDRCHTNDVLDREHRDVVLNKVYGGQPSGNSSQKTWNSIMELIR